MFFEDGGTPPNRGFFDNGDGTGSLKTESNPSGYKKPHSSGWKDCIMRQALKNLGNASGNYCLLGAPGAREKFNCQDWADAMRAEYDKILNDPSALASCCGTP